jgi:hypothetical protein
VVRDRGGEWPRRRVVGDRSRCDVTERARAGEAPRYALILCVMRERNRKILALAWIQHRLSPGRERYDNRRGTATTTTEEGASQAKQNSHTKTSIAHHKIPPRAASAITRRRTQAAVCRLRTFGSCWGPIVEWARVGPVERGDSE